MDRSLWMVIGAAALGGLLSFGLARLGWRRLALGLVLGPVALAAVLILAGRAEGGWGGLGMIAVAAVMVLPFAGGALVGMLAARWRR